MVPDQDQDQLSLPLPPDGAPDLECAICFSQFNNVFRTPKMLQCKHTFCLECLARMNVKSSEPDAIHCPLCRGVTPLPDLGLPKLETNPTVLSYLPRAMQRVCSIRFSRSRGRLQVKGPPTVSDSLDLGHPAHCPASGHAPQPGSILPCSSKPSCHLLVMFSCVLLLVLITCIVIIILKPKA